MLKLVIMLAAAVAVALGGCNTIAGFGRDLQEAGGAIEDAASP